MVGHIALLGKKAIQEGEKNIRFRAIQTAHNRSVYAAPPSAAWGSVA
jgi:hypothetical protein